MISVIVPTMWRYEPFIRFVNELVKVPVIGEVIIIDNEPASAPADGLSHPKIRYYPQQTNIVVNPAWNLGARVSQYNKLCFLNDDVIVDIKVFYKIDEWLSEHVGVVGVRPPDPSNNDHPFVSGSIKIVPHQGETLYDFGSLFFIHRKNWIEIPSELVNAFGDNWVYDSQMMLNRKMNYLITDIFFHHAGKQTNNYIGGDSTIVERPLYQRLYEEMKRSVIDDGKKNVLDYLELEYQDACKAQPTNAIYPGLISDIYVHVPRLRALASTVKHVTEMGVRDAQSTKAFLVNDVVLRSYDIKIEAPVVRMFEAARSIGKDVQYIEANSLHLDIEPTDLLFLDTDHVYHQLKAELDLHHSKARKYIVCHDTHKPCGLETLPAIMEFLADHPEWRVKTHYTDCSGLTILERLW